MLPSCNIFIFEIPLILDLICDSLTKQDLFACLNVCRLWCTLFQLQFVRYVRFADLKAPQTRLIINHAHRIQHLQIDVADARWLLHPARCINLKTLSCVDFGYIPCRASCDHPSPEAVQYQTCHVLASEDDEDDEPLLQRLERVDPTMNALRLVQQNPGLTHLEFEHCRRHYGLSHFDPEVLTALSTHRSLTRIKIILNYKHQDDSQILFSVLKHLPDTLLDLEFCAHWELDRLNLEFCAHWDLGRLNLSLSAEEQSELYPVGIFRKTNRLRRLKLNGTEFGSVPPLVVLQLIRNAPQLSELSLGYIVYDGERLLQDVVTACPSLKVLELKNQTCLWTGQPIRGSLRSLRTFYLKMRTRGPHEEVDTISEFLARSGASLQTVRISILNSAPATVRLFQNLRRCTQLTSLRTGESQVSLDAVCQVPWGEDFPHLQILELWIKEQEYACREHARSAYKEGRLLVEGVSEHVREVVSQICALFRSLKALKDLKELSLKWELCASVQSLSQEAILRLMASNDEEEEGLASRATGIEVIEFLGLKWQTLADMNAQVALFRKQEEMRIMRWRDSRIQMSRSIQRRHGSFWADWEALGNDPCLACQLDRDPYRERIRCYCGDGEELYADMETAASGQWYSNRKAYFKTGKSHHRRSLKYIWRYQVAN